MDTLGLITSWGDTFPAWLGGLGGVLSVVITWYALVAAVRANERHVEWQKTFIPPRKEGMQPHNFELRNGTAGVSAKVLAIDDVTDGLRDAVRSNTPVPIVIEAGNGILLNIDRSMASGYPTAVKVTWQEGRPHKRARRRQYTTTFYFD